MTLDELRRLAEAATPGPWNASNERVLNEHSAPIAYTLLSTHDSTLIAACSPERILAMIECIKASDAARRMNTDEAVAILDSARTNLDEAMK